jgi:membrane protein DedA with SNARE-associated domain/rhodanese-related sulfurtransferase
MGALSRSGEVSFAAVVATASAAALIADLIWYELGHLHGRSVLRLLCRISLEPDSCVRRTEDAFERLELWVLIPAKFVPGFNAAAVPFAGMMKTPLFRFLAFDIPAITLWSGSYTLLGYVFSSEIERLLMYLGRLGTSLFVFVGAVVAVYIVYKIRQRKKFLKALSVMRITPEELKARMDARHDILVFDMRNRLDRNMDPVRIPGAFHILPEHIEFHPDDLDFSRDIVIYCNCPNEATSARVAIQLQRKGLTKARPLQGGLEAWRARNFPVESLD